MKRESDSRVKRNAEKNGEEQEQSMAGRGSGEQEQEHGDERTRLLALRHRPSPVVGGESFDCSSVAVLLTGADS